jgi:GT2 family glycosyltransferase
MTDLTTVSIIIPVRNGARFLPACLTSLQAEQQAMPELKVQIIVIDNASVDESAVLVARRFPEVQLIRNGVNQGFAGGCNQGLRVSTADVSILLNQDTRVFPGWLAAILRAFENPAVGVVGCKIFYPDGKTLQHAGGYIEYPRFYGLHYGHHEADEGQANESRVVEWVTGAAFAIRKALLDKIGLLDEGFWPGYFEDVDYCLRTRLADYQVWYCAEAHLIHQETSSKIDEVTLQRFYQRGRLRCSLKHLSPPQWLTEFFPRELQDLHLATPGLRNAYWDMFENAPAILRQQWQAEPAQIEEVLAALRILVDIDPGRARPLEEFEFTSSLPIVGKIFSRFRELWYNVAARWAVRHLQRQLEANDQLYRHQIAMLQRQIDHLALSNAALAQQLAQQRSEPSLGTVSPSINEPTVSSE